MDYRFYSEEDFISDEKFQNWVLHPSGDLDSFWEQWMLENPDKKDVVMNAREVLLLLEFEENFPSEEQVNIALQRTLCEIEAAEQQSRSRKFWGIRLAAVFLALVIGYGVFEYVGSKYGTTVKAKGSEIATVPSKDSSGVLQNTNLSPIYAEGYYSDGNQRNLELWGMPSLEVKHYKVFRNICIEP